MGGGCRKNSKVSAKKSNDQPIMNQNHPGSSSSQNPTDLHLSFPEVQLSHLTHILSTQGTLGNPNFMDANYHGLLENPRPIDFMESKLQDHAAGIGNSINYDFMGNGDLGMVGGLTQLSGHALPPNFHGLCSPFGSAPDGNRGTFVDTCQRLMLPYDANHEDHNATDVKPNAKLLSLDWQDQGCSDAGKDSFGYLSGLGSWTGMMSGYGPSTANQLI